MTPLLFVFFVIVVLSVYETFRPCRKMTSTDETGAIFYGLDDETVWWTCECGYAMPEPLQTCVKCGASRPQMTEAVKA